MRQRLPNHLVNPIDTPNEIWEQKVGYDFANKRMIAKVYKHLYYVMELMTKPTWTNVIYDMLNENNKINQYEQKETKRQKPCNL